MKTAELTGAALDWAVAMAENWAGADFEIKPYSTDWAQGGPIVEQRINRLQEITDGVWQAEAWGVVAEGPTALAAAMRCHVAVELGDDVEIPAELR